MQQKLIAVALTTFIAVSPVFAAKAKSVKHRKRDYSVTTLATRSSSLSHEVSAKANQVSGKSVKSRNKKMQQQASLLHKAAGELHTATQDLLKAKTLSKR